MKPIAENAEIEFETTPLSPSMEDYLEAIALIALEKRVVRVKDIAQRLKIKNPSVTAALRKLAEKDLIDYQKYGYVDLTEEGRRIAGQVYQKHSCLAEFLQQVLRLDGQSAGEEACRIEHHLSPEACRQIHRLTSFYRAEKLESEKWTERFDQIMEERHLSDLKPGDLAVIKRINGTGPLRKRLQEMGFRRGERLRVVKYAPLRDPLQINLKGYNISLRVDEAKQIVVVPVEATDDQSA